MNTITFKNERQAALFSEEIQGQLSDGWWENDGGRAKKLLWSAEVRVGDPVGCDFYNSRRYDLTELMDEVDDVKVRMFEIGRRFDREYTTSRLACDLKEIAKVMRTQIAIAA